MFKFNFNDQPDESPDIIPVNIDDIDKEPLKIHQYNYQPSLHIVPNPNFKVPEIPNNQEEEIV
jgi:hypothetical protein